jgi:hypothetical protein
MQAIGGTYRLDPWHSPLGLQCTISFDAGVNITAAKDGNG